MNRRRSKGFFESSNPYLNEQAYANSTVDHSLVGADETMTVSGAVNKSFLLGSIMLCTAAISFYNGSSILTFGGAIAGLIFVIIASFNRERSGLWAPLYAAAEGLFVGGITAMYASLMEGIIFQAVGITFGIFFGMLAIYKSGLIKVTKSFRTGIIMATFGVFGLYMMTWILGFFGMQMPFLHEATPIGLLISFAILGIASLNLLLDFDLFEKGEQYGAPAYMEWFSAMGLLITLVWIYVEVLRIIYLLQGRE